MALPTCQCVAGQPPFARFDDIFCALSQIDLACVIPTVVSATIQFDGSTIIIVFSEEVTGTGEGLIVNSPVGAATLTLLSGEGTDTLTYDMDLVAQEGDVATLDYTPGNIANGECLLVAFTDFPVTNNTGLASYYLRPDGVSRYLRPDGVSFYLRP